MVSSVSVLVHHELFMRLRRFAIYISKYIGKELKSCKVHFGDSKENEDFQTRRLEIQLYKRNHL